MYFRDGYIVKDKMIRNRQNAVDVLAQLKTKLMFDN